MNKTAPLLHRSLVALEAIAAAGGKVLFVATKHQAKDIVKDAAERCGQYYVNNRWLGGMLTNFTTIKTRIARLKNLEKMQEDGTFDVLPKIINDRTMVPLRAIFEAIGAKVDWYGETRTIVSSKDDIEIRMQIDNNIMHVNDNIITLDAFPCIDNDRTLVPVRAIAESFGFDVAWDGETRTVTITK